MASKKLLQFDRLLSISDTVACYCVIGGQDYYFLLSDLLTYVRSGMFPELTTTCTNATTTNINIGAVATSKKFEITYLAKRGDTRLRAGTLLVLSDGSSVIPEPLIFPYAKLPNNLDEDLGIIITSDVNSGQARLNIEVDTSDANDVIFKYSIKTTE